jgi:putative ABC transport system ATP-binding protein
MADTTVLRTHALSKGYTLGSQHIRVLHAISLAIDKNEYVAIMGRSGSGKSTLLNILGCLDVADSGSYYFRDKDVSTLSGGALADIRNYEIGFVFQNFNLLPKLNIRENITLPLIYANVAARTRNERTTHIMQRFGLYERATHKPNEISGGQKQRVAIARAVVKQPALILADEPTGNLDSTTTEEILTVFDELHRDGNTIVMVTHEDDVARRAQRIIYLEDGRIRT